MRQNILKRIFIYVSFIIFFACPVISFAGTEEALQARQAIQSVRAQLDAAFNNQDVPGYMALLAPGFVREESGMDCTPEVRQIVRVVYSERETIDYEPQAPHLYQRVQVANPA